MPILTVQNLFDFKLEIEPGQTLLRALQAAGVDWMHACGGRGRCTSCRIVVQGGLDHFGPLTASEERYRQNGRLKPDERLTCQCTLDTGNATGSVPRQTMLPHMKYS